MLRIEQLQDGVSYKGYYFLNAEILYMRDWLNTEFPAKAELLKSYSDIAVITCISGYYEGGLDRWVCRELED